MNFEGQGQKNLKHLVWIQYRIAQIILIAEEVKSALTTSGKGVLLNVFTYNIQDGPKAATEAYPPTRECSIDGGLVSENWDLYLIRPNFL